MNEDPIPRDGGDFDARRRTADDEISGQIRLLRGRARLVSDDLGGADRA